MVNDGASPEEDVTECPEGAADLQQKVTCWDDMRGDEGRRDIVGAHFCDG